MNSDSASTVCLDRSSTSKNSVAILPLGLGCTGLIVSLAYQMQRAGIFLNSFYSLDRFMQRHLDGVSGLASIVAFLGVIAGLAIARTQSSRRIIAVGTLISAAVLLWSIFVISL